MSPTQPPTRWGILGTGAIARKFAADLQRLPAAKLVAVGSRSAEAANAFADAFAIPRRHASYEALAADVDVDAIYVATPHVFHRDDCRRCLAHGKAVLGEKPFTMNVSETEAVFTAARTSGAFVMEAMWTRFFPAVAKLLALLHEGAIGEVRRIQADFAFAAPFDPASRLFNPALGGGALLDIGVYTVAFARMVTGAEPTQILSQAVRGTTGVDEQAAMILTYPGDIQALLSCGLRNRGRNDAVVEGSHGRLRLPEPFWAPQAVEWRRNDGTETRLDFPVDGHGYQFEAEELMRCRAAGAQESPRWSWADTRSVQRVLDAALGSINGAMQSL